MSYANTEHSTQEGEPIFLYHFHYGGFNWRFTNITHEVTYQAETYLPIAISHSGIKRSQELSKASCTITMEPYPDLTDRFFGWMPEESVTVVIHRTHWDETDGRILWTGRIAAHERSGAHEKFSLESVYTSLSKNGLRQHTQLACRYGIYHRGCTVDKSAYATAGSITATNALVMTVSEATGQADGYYSGGLMTFPDGTLRTIANHTGDQLTLTQPVRYLYDNALPVAVTIYPGCDKTRQTCTTRFNNLINFGGFPWIPATNPLGGNSIV